jgi:hypothetical protein
MVWEVEYGTNTIYKCVNGKMKSTEIISGMRGGGAMENDGGGEFKYDIFDVL